MRISFRKFLQIRLQPEGADNVDKDAALLKRRGSPAKNDEQIYNTIKEIADSPLSSNSEIEKIVPVLTRRAVSERKHGPLFGLDTYSRLCCLASSSSWPVLKAAGSDHVPAPLLLLALGCKWQFER